jgi:hypothetical protein
VWQNKNVHNLATFGGKQIKNKKQTIVIVAVRGLEQPNMNEPKSRKLVRRAPSKIEQADCPEQI